MVVINVVFLVAGKKVFSKGRYSLTFVIMPGGGVVIWMNCDSENEIPEASLLDEHDKSSSPRWIEQGF